MLRILKHIGLALAGFCLAAGSVAAAATLPPVEAFGMLPGTSVPKLSPDGKHFATIQSLHGRPAAVIYTVDAPPDTQPKVVSDSEAVILDVEWAKNDRLLITINMNVKAGEDKVHSWFRTISVDAEGKSMVLMFSNSTWRDYNYSAATVVDFDLDDPHSVFMPLYVPGIEDGAQLSLYQVDVTTGDAERVQSGGANTDLWIMDGHGHVVARGDESLHPLVDHLKLFQDGDWKEVAKYDATGGHGSGVVGITEDGASLVQAGVSDKEGTHGLIRKSLANGDEDVLYANPSFDITDPIEDPWTGRVIGVAFADDRMRYHYFDPAMQALQDELDTDFADLSARAVSWDTTRNRVIVEVSGPRHPPNYYFIDRSDHVVSKVSESYGDLRKSDLGEMKPYLYKARDGLDIPAYLTLPPGKAPKNLPTVIFPHGGPGDRDMMQFDWMAQFFANRGYAVLQPNFRGSTGYGLKFEEEGYGQWGLKMQDDVTDGVKKMIADGIADPKRICIVGASYGGYAALAGAAYTPDLYACAVSFAGVFDLGRFLSSRASEYGKDSWMISTWTRYIGDRYDDSGKLDAASPARNAELIKCPVLLMHGAGDTTVRIEQSEIMRDALQSKGKTVEFVKFDSDSHYMLLADTRIRVLKETEQFLTKYIGN